MSFFRIALFGIALFGFILALWSFSGNAQNDVSELKKEILEKSERVVTEPNKQISEPNTQSFEGKWRIFGGSIGGIGHDEIIEIRRLHSPRGEYVVRSSTGNELFSETFRSQFSEGTLSLISTFEKHGCEHRVVISEWKVESEDSGNGQDKETMQIFNAHEHMGVALNIDVNHHIHEDQQENLSCDIPGHHLGHAHAGGTGGNNN